MNSTTRGQSNDMIKPETVERLQAGVPAAFALLAGMQLEIFTHLADGPRGAAELAAALGVAEDRLSRLLYALVVAGLLERRKGEFGNTPEAAAFLVKGLPNYLGGAHELLAQLWRADLLSAQSIRLGAPAALHDFNASSSHETAAMLRGMHPSAVAAGRDLARRFDFSGCQSIVDIGGGAGGLVAALCEAYPALHGSLYELPGNAVLAVDILRETSGGDRVSIETGDILVGRPRKTYDATVMRALVQVLAPADAARAIINAAAATRPGGSIYILGGGILNNDRIGPPSATYLNVTFMNLYPAGASYTEAEHAAWLAAAGCGEPQRIVLPSGGSIIHAKRLQGEESSEPKAES
jgi:DNA-binding transcriptional ArsR family regulator